MKNMFLPLIGVNEIRFGFSRAAIRETLGSDYIEIKRNEFAVNSSDFYEKLGFFVEYNLEGFCDAIEFSNSSNIYFEGHDLISLSYTELRIKYDKISLKIEEEDEIGVTYHDLGFGLTKEFGSSKNESVIVFSKDYWS